MAGQVISIGKGVSLAAGLKWFPVPGGKAKERNAYIRSITQRLGFDLQIAMKQPFQTGFANTADGYRAGMVSMAAAVHEAVKAATKTATFQCAFQIEGDSWGYVAVRQDLIVPSAGGFRNDFIGSESEVRSQFISAMDAGWDAMVAPSHWEIPNSIDLGTADVMPRRKDGRLKANSAIRLSRVMTSTEILKRVLLILMMVLLGGGIYWYWQNQKAKEAEEQKRLEALAAQRKVDMKPWKKIPAPQVFVKVCQQTFNKLPNLFPTGWAFNSALCSGEKLSIVWNREVDGLPAQLQKAQPEASIAPTGNTAELIIPLKMEKGQDDKVGPLDERRMEMLNIALRDGIPLKFKDRESIGKKVKKSDKQGKQASTKLRTASFVIKDMDVLPYKAIESLDGPGMRLQHMQIKMKDGLFTWSLEGTQYGH